MILQSVSTMCVDKNESDAGIRPRKTSQDTRRKFNPMNWSHQPLMEVMIPCFISWITRCLTFCLTVGISTLQRLQANIADSGRYILGIVTCLVYSAILVSMLPVTLTLQCLRETQSRSLSICLDFMQADLIVQSTNAVREDFQRLISCKMRIFLSRFLDFMSKCLSILAFFVPLLMYYFQYSHPVLVLNLYLVLVLLVMCLCEKEPPDPPKTLTSREYSMLLRRMRKERSKRRRQYLDMLDEMENDIFRDPIARRKRFKRLRHKYSPQSGLKSVALNLLRDEAGNVLAAHQDLIMKEIEDLVLLYIRVRDCKTWKGVMANIVSDVKKRFSTSLSGVVLQCVEDLFKETHESELKRAHDLTYDIQAGELTDERSWLRVMRTAYSNWKLATNNEGFEKMSKLLSLLVGAGLINMTSLNIDVNGLQAFSEITVPKHVSAFDLLDATMSTVVYFVEGGYECICTGNLKPLLYGEHEMRKFDDDYLKCAKYADFARPGNLALLGIDENDLDSLYSETIDLGKRLSKTSKSVMVRKHIQDRLVRLQDMHSKFTQFRQTGNIREKPYCIGIFGGSSVGKSTIGPLLMTSTLYFNGFRADDESQIVLNEHDKYMSNYKSSINGVFLDDVGNTLADFVETAPTVRILEMVNNVKMYANMAEAELKGKVSIQPKVVVCTTNTKDFCATTYSNEPVSIARRANYIVTANVKPQFATNNMLDESKVFAFYGEDPPEIPDLWTFNVEKAYPIPNTTKNGRATIGWKTIVWNGTKLQDIDMNTLIRFTNLDSKHHFENQKKVVKSISNLSQKLTFCETCRSHKTLCLCDVEDHVISYVDSPREKSPMERDQQQKRGSQRQRNKQRRQYTRQAGVYRSDDWSWESVKTYLTPDRNWTWGDVYNRAERLINYRSVYWTSWLPSSWFANSFIRLCIAWAYGRFPRKVVYAHLILPFASLILFCLLGRFTLIISCVFAILASISVIYTWRCEYDLLLETVSGTRTAEQSVISERKKKVAYLLAGCVVLTGLYKLIKAAQSKREFFNVQGMMHPTQYEIDERDAHDLTSTVADEQNWANVYVSPVPVSHKSKTTTFADFKNLAIGNSTFMCYKQNGKYFGCDAFFVCSNVALVPKHAWKQDDMLCEFTRHDKRMIGGNFRSYISRKHSVDIEGMDASLVWIPNGGSWKDLRDFFPQIAPTANTPSEFIWKDDAGVIHRSPTMFKPQNVTNGFMKFIGGKYELNFPTRAGLCMSPLVAEAKSPYFAGFHLGGIDGTPKGCAGTIIRAQINDAMEALQKCPGVLLGSSAGTFETEKYGIQFMENNQIHEKSPLRKLPIKDGVAPNLEVFGSCLGRVTYYSDVVTSHISKHVESVCGVKNQWGKPKFRKGDPWHTSLEHSSHPSHGFEGSLLVKSVEDYVRPFEKLLQEYSALRTSTRPLTRMETICGIDGKKFVDKMPPNTSVGYPLGGPKRKFLTYLDPAMFEGFNCPAELDDMFWTEFDKAKAGYVAGERYYPAFKACLKDEPTKLSKDKVRVFQAAPIVLQMMTRMYFLPVARIFSLFPELSECAVGVNCMGPDWSELSRHMRHFGADRILAGDYSKYDLRMPAQVMFAAFRIMIDVAILCGYSNEDIRVMQGIATDICYPVMAYNGDLVQHIGSNPSGQNLTVYINSIVNSLLFRCAFFHLKGTDCKTSFRDVCKLMTYGDDVKGSVKPGYDDFNHLYVAEFFADHDMKFTMPDKESFPVPFMRDVDADFLKRKNVYCPETGYVMGALDEDSIFKSLHSNLKSTSNTREKLAADNIDGALREWFNHGRGTYETRRAQMQEVAERANITHICSMLDCTYDQYVERWNDRYIHCIDSEEDDADDDYSVQSGCYVQSIIPLYDQTGAVVDSFQIIDCGQGNLYMYLFTLSIVLVTILVGFLCNCGYSPQSGRLTYAPELRPRRVLRPPPPLNLNREARLYDSIHEFVLAHVRIEMRRMPQHAAAA